MRSVLPSLGLLLAAAAAWAEPAGRELDKHPSTAPLSPEESMQRLRLPPGFRLELVAAEPMIREPVALSWDGNGRMYVVEMRGYMQTLDGKGAQDPVGRISRLEDSDGDGRMDRHSIYLDGLVEPRAVLAVGDGVLVGEPPNLWYCRDTSGDGKANEKILVTDRFSLRNSNVEHKANSLTRGIDNWIHVSQHGRRYRYVEGAFRHERVPTIGQWGLARDETGRLIFSSNSTPAIGLFVPPRYFGDGAAKDAHRPAMSAIAAQDDHGSVWPAMVTPDLQSGPGLARGDGSLRAFTAACGQSVFRGDRLGDGIKGDYFICEPVGRLVRRSMVGHPDSGHIELTNRHENDIGEFITSTDGNFRPVNTRTGPDGCLYIVDMYRGIIQEKAYITPYLREQILKHGYQESSGRGRIYRVVREGVAPGPRPRLLDAGPAELVGQLAHPNGWWRDTAQGLLVTRGDASVAGDLRTMALEHADPVARLHALWTMDGLGLTDFAAVKAVASDEDHRLRIAALGAAENLPQVTRPGPDPLVDLLDELSRDPQPLVAAQVILTASRRAGSEARRIAAQCVASHPDNPAVAHSARAVMPAK